MHSVEGEFGQLLRNRRVAANLTQEELAERAGLSIDAVRRLEGGTRRAPYRDTVSRLAAALDLEESQAEHLIAAANRARRRGPPSASNGEAPTTAPPRRHTGLELALSRGWVWACIVIFMLAAAIAIALLRQAFFSYTRPLASAQGLSSPIPVGAAFLKTRGARGVEIAYGDFRLDRSLNRALWTDNSPYLTQILEGFDNPRATAITPTLQFSRRTGMTMSGVATSYEQTGIQSNLGFIAPFTAKLEAALTSSTTGGLGVAMVNDDANAGAQINLSHAFGRYDGIWYEAAGPSNVGSGADPWEFLGSIAPSVRTGAKYTLTIRVDSTGNARLCASIAGEQIGCGSARTETGGPFYMILSTGAGAAPGSPVANWYVASVK